MDARSSTNMIGDVEPECCLNRLVAGSLNPQRLGLTLLPTADCNFQCAYCYEEHVHSEMDGVVVAAVKQLLDARVPELRVLNVEWFGGEPLLALPAIVDISVHILRLIGDRTDLHYTGGMTTNGFLLDEETFRRLTSLKISSFQVSLDGTREQHNRTRCGNGARGTFDRIWSNLLAMRAAKDISARIMLRIHVFPGNCEDLPTLLDSIVDEFGDDSRFCIFLKPLAKLGGASDEVFPFFTSKEQQAEAERLLWSRVPEHMVYRVAEPNVCYAAQANSLVISPDGTINKCTVAFDDSRNKVGMLQADGSLQIDRDMFSLWMEWLETGDLERAGCPYLKGVCQKQVTG